MTRGATRVLVDATWLDPAHGPLESRMGRFEAILSLVVIGPRFASVRAALLAAENEHRAADRTLLAVSSIGREAVIARVAAECFEHASRALRTSFEALAHTLGDDPFARKW